MNAKTKSLFCYIFPALGGATVVAIRMGRRLHPA